MKVSYEPHCLFSFGHHRGLKAKVIWIFALLTWYNLPVVHHVLRISKWYCKVKVYRYCETCPSQKLVFKYHRLSEGNYLEKTCKSLMSWWEAPEHNASLVFVNLVSFGNGVQVRPGLQFLWRANIQPLSWNIASNCFKVDKRTRQT